MPERTQLGPGRTYRDPNDGQSYWTGAYSDGAVETWVYDTGQQQWVGPIAVTYDAEVRRVWDTESRAEQEKTKAQEKAQADQQDAQKVVTYRRVEVDGHEYGYNAYGQKVVDYGLAYQAPRAQQPDEFTTWTDPADGSVWKVNARTLEKVERMSPGKPGPAKGIPGQEEVGPGGIPVGYWRSDGAWHEYDASERNARIRQLQGEGKLPQGQLTATPGTGGGGGGGGLSAAETAMAASQKRDELWQAVSRGDIPESQAIADFDEWWKVTVDLPRIRNEVGRAAVKDYLDTIPYRVGPGFAQKSADALNAIRTGTQSPSAWAPEDFMFDLPDLDAMADAAVRRIFGETAMAQAGAYAGPAAVNPAATATPAAPAAPVAMPAPVVAPAQPYVPPYVPRARGAGVAM